METHSNPIVRVTTDSAVAKLAYMSIESSAISAILSAGNTVGYKTTAIGNFSSYAATTLNSCSSNAFTNSWVGMTFEVAYYDPNQDKYIQKSTTGTYSEFTGP